MRVTGSVVVIPKYAFWHIALYRPTECHGKSGLEPSILARLNAAVTLNFTFGNFRQLLAPVTEVYRGFSVFSGEFRVITPPSNKPFPPLSKSVP